MIQGAALPEFGKLRYHKMNVGFFNEAGDLVEKKEVMLLNREETVITYTTDEKIAGVIPNIDDLTFIKIILDETTLQWVQRELINIKDPLTRQLSWRSMFEMVRDANFLKSTDFVKLAFEHLPNEEESTVAGMVKGYLNGIISAYVPEKFYYVNMALGFKMTLTC